MCGCEAHDDPALICTCDCEHPPRAKATWQVGIEDPVAREMRRLRDVWKDETKALEQIADAARRAEERASEDRNKAVNAEVAARKRLRDINAALDSLGWQDVQAEQGGAS